jgi:thiol-disulfide isomerase/thioredoxin
MEAKGRPVPDEDIATASAPGVPAPPEKIAVGGGSWTWINFWAAWCVPCKEEIPRLLAWEKQLTQASSAFRVAFITLDDDQRQLDQYLATQAATGLRATYWLREGEEREKWLKEAGMDHDPELPVHLLVDDRGLIRCIIQGAVEDADYPRVAELVGGGS